ncbi:MAG: hypothetical protein K0S65_201 [Labilithrix sp.]|nr:hypothetical protein [Labilithrix sp.]
MFCHSCRSQVTPVPPRSIWKVLSVAFWVGSLTIAAGFSLLLGLNLVLAPAAIFIGMSIGACARKLNNWTCPRCDAELVEPEPTSELQTVRRRPPRGLTPAAAGPGAGPHP